MVERLNEQIVEQEELIAAQRRDYEALQMEMTRIQAENDSAKDEVSDTRNRKSIRLLPPLLSQRLTFLLSILSKHLCFVVRR